LLAVDSHLVIFNFIHPREHHRRYAHDYRLTTFKIDPSAAGTWSASYFLANREIVLVPNHVGSFSDPSNWMSVDPLRKFDLLFAFPEDSGAEELGRELGQRSTLEIG